MHSQFVRPVLALAVVASVLFITGCTSMPGNDQYSRHELMQRQTEEAGTILAFRHVRIQGEGSGVGALIGASAGGGVGSGIGKGRGASINAGLFGIAGAIVGGVVEDRLSQTDATEMSVRLDTGKIMSVVVPGKLNFVIGEPVRVLSGQGYTRVVPAMPAQPAAAAVSSAAPATAR
jgi:outer membrane lipoprotein SlyB